MILILSGKYQREEYFARKQFPALTFSKKNVSDFSYDISDDIDEAAYELTGRVLSEKSEVIFCHIMGCGVVPVDEKLRFHAELVGRASCILAEKADEVWVVRAGIGTRIK